MKTIFITGAAAGIGLATARYFAGEGWFVGLYDINEDAIGHLLQSPVFSNACGGPCDVSNHGSVSQALQHFAERTEGRMDVLLNNAGVLTAGHFEDIDPAAHESIIQVNVQGLTNVAQLGFPWLQKSPNSALVNLCSVSSVHGLPQLAVYSASKFYVNGLSQALSIAWQVHDIRVIAIKPPIVKTGMADAIPEEMMGVFTVDLVPEQVAEAIMDALSGSGESYLLGWKAKVWGAMDKYLPRALGRLLTKILSGN